MENMLLKSQLDTRELLLLESEMKTRGKNMLTGYLLWYFVGIFGGHRFYMGKTGTAIAQLVLSITLVGMIVTAVWWIVDAFLLYSSINEHNQRIENYMIHHMLSSRNHADPTFHSYNPDSINFRG